MASNSSTIACIKVKTNRERHPEWWPGVRGPGKNTSDIKGEKLGPFRRVLRGEDQYAHSGCAPGKRTKSLKKTKVADNERGEGTTEGQTKSHQ